MRAYELVAAVLGVLSSSAIAKSQEARPPIDVTVCVTGTNLVPRYDNRVARITASRMFARIGVRIAWLDGEPRTADTFTSRVVIQVRFTEETPGEAHPRALAYASPFAERGNIVVLWDRIRYVADGWELEGPILAHVLAHEIGHVLKGTTGHSQTGVMKASWDRQEYYAMAQKPLEFTSSDVDLIRQGLNRLKARAGYQAGDPS